MINSTLTASTTALAALPSYVSQNEVQKFEQSYETWVQTLTQTVAPSVPVTVLVELEYSSSQEKLENYEEALESNHLPGLPDVIDPHYRHPSESPLYALVTQQKIKIILEGTLNQTQKKILNEILTNKLKIKSARGDRLTLQEINTSFLNSLLQTRKRQAAVIALAVLLIAAFGAAQQKRSPTLKKPALKKAAVTFKKNFSEQISQVNSKLAWYTKNTVDPVQFILKADTKILLTVIRTEKPLHLAQVIQGLNESVAATLLKLCSREQRNEIKSILRFSKPTGIFNQSICNKLEAFGME